MSDSENIILQFKLDGLQEHVIWAEKVLEHVQDLPDNVLRIVEYGFSEMVNNAIDHSEGTNLGIVINRSPDKIEIWIMDDGVGIFDKIQKVFDLADPWNKVDYYWWLKTPGRKLTQASFKNKGMLP